MLNYHHHCQLEPLDNFNKDYHFQYRQECQDKANLKYLDQLHLNIIYLPPWLTMSTWLCLPLSMETAWHKDRMTLKQRHQQ